MRRQKYATRRLPDFAARKLRVSSEQALELRAQHVARAEASWTFRNTFRAIPRAALDVVDEAFHLRDQLGWNLFVPMIFLGVLFHFLHQLVEVLGSCDKVAVHSSIPTTNLFHGDLLLFWAAR